MVSRWHGQPRRSSDCARRARCRSRCRSPMVRVAGRTRESSARQRRPIPSQARTARTRGTIQTSRRPRGIIRCPGVRRAAGGLAVLSARPMTRPCPIHRARAVPTGDERIDRIGPNRRRRAYRLPGDTASNPDTYRGEAVVGGSPLPPTTSPLSPAALPAAGDNPQSGRWHPPRHRPFSCPRRAHPAMRRKVTVCAAKSG